MIFAAISTLVTLLGPLSNGPSLPAITERVVHHPSRRLRCRARKFTESLNQEEEGGGRGSGERGNKDARLSFLFN